MPGFKNTLVRTTGNPGMAALGTLHHARLIQMVVRQQPDYEGLNASSYNPYETAGGTAWKAKMGRHNKTAIKDLITKQSWDEFGSIGPDLRDRVLAAHNETHGLYTLNNYLYTQLNPMKACDGCKNTSADDFVKNRRKYSSDRSRPCEFPGYVNVLSGLHQQYALAARNGLLQQKSGTIWLEHKMPKERVMDTQLHSRRQGRACEEDEYRHRVSCDVDAGNYSPAPRVHGHAAGPEVWASERGFNLCVVRRQLPRRAPGWPR
jgi:hypothetical protein